MDSSADQWESRYQSGETGWDRGASSPSLNAWLQGDGLKSGSGILVPGCGRGHEVIHLAELGFKVTGIDIAPSAITHLKQALQARGLSAEVLQADLFEFKPTQPFDAVYEQTCLCAIQPEQREAYEALLYDWIKPDGTLFALFMQTGAEDGPPFHCDLLTMRKLFPDNRWQWPLVEPVFTAHRNGRFELGYQLKRR